MVEDQNTKTFSALKERGLIEANSRRFVREFTPLFSALKERGLIEALAVW